MINPPVKDSTPFNTHHAVTTHTPTGHSDYLHAGAAGATARPEKFVVSGKKVSRFRLCRCVCTLELRAAGAMPGEEEQRGGQGDAGQVVEMRRRQEGE